MTAASCKLAVDAVVRSSHFPQRVYPNGSFSGVSRAVHTFVGNVRGWT